MFLIYLINKQKMIIDLFVLLEIL